MSAPVRTFAELVQRHVPKEVRIAEADAAAKAKEKRAKMTPEQHFKAVARNYAGSCKRRAKLIPHPCAICGDARAQMHHSDYNRPAIVEWLCRPCHIHLHRLVEAKYLRRAYDDAIAEMKAILANLRSAA